MESDTFYGDFMVLSIWRLSGKSICHIFSMKTPDSFYHKISIKSVTLHTVSMLIFW